MFAASPRPPDPLGAALAALAPLAPEAQVDAAERRLLGERAGPLAALDAGVELAPAPGRLDGRLLEAICARALAGAPGAVFTPAPEGRILAGFGLACAAEGRGGPPLAEALAMLLGEERPSPALRRALRGLRLFDPGCGGGALLVAAERLGRSCGVRLRLAGLDLSPLAARACAARLALLGAEAEIAAGDALERRWPDADLVLANPPFVRHEALSRASKAAAVRATGLPAQADLSAHFAALAIRRAPVAALVWPRAFFTSRSAAPLVAEARARGGFALLLRSRAAGSFPASVDTCLAVWREGGSPRPAAEASAPLGELSDGELLALAGGWGGRRLRLAPGRAPAPAGAVTVGDVCQVRFGMKSGCNAFFHLRRLGPGRYASDLAGEVALDDGDAAPLLASLKEARAPEWAEPGWFLFRPPRPSASARRYASRGERLGVHRRPTCASRSPWWRVAAGRAPAPVLYPAKIGARAFAFLNAAGLCEDKKWHALFPRALEPWMLATVLSSTPVRLGIDLRARQLTGAQAIADVDCGVLAAAPFPRPEALPPLAADLSRCREALARDPVTTDLAAALSRPAQEELDLLVGRALGMTPAAVRRARVAMLARVEARLAQASRIRAACG